VAVVPGPRAAGRIGNGRRVDPRFIVRVDSQWVADKSSEALRASIQITNVDVEDLDRASQRVNPGLLCAIRQGWASGGSSSPSGREMC